MYACEWNAAAAALVGSGRVAQRVIIEHNHIYTGDLVERLDAICSPIAVLGPSGHREASNRHV